MNRNMMGKAIGIFVVGLLAGMAVFGVAAWFIAPRLMLSTHQSQYDIDETCERLRAAIEANGWKCPGVRNMNDSMAKEGVTMEAQVRIVELCKADYAKDVLVTNPEVSTLMPCAFGVYEKDERVYVTGMNMGLMGKLFGGNIAAVMGGKVAVDEKAILECLH